MRTTPPCLLALRFHVFEQFNAPKTIRPLLHYGRLAISSAAGKERIGVNIEDTELSPVRTIRDGCLSGASHFRDIAHYHVAEDTSTVTPQAFLTVGRDRSVHD